MPETNSIQPLQPAAVRYIKLGPGGAWLDRCVETGVIELGHQATSHDLALGGDRDAIEKQLVTMGRTPGKAKDFARELTDFYQLGSDCLWVTIGRGRLWWGFAEPEVHPTDEPGRGARYRRMINGWSDKALNGELLSLSRLSTRLTKVAAYQQTICKITAEDYLLRRINGLDEPAVQRALQARAEMIACVRDLIQMLDWRDFEVLTDLIFAANGWRRTSGVGGSDQADTDLILEQPATGERAFVQVKSASGVARYRDYVERFRADPSFQRMFFVCHSPSGHFPPEPGVHVWLGDTLAEQVLEAGLINWILVKGN